MLKKAINKIVRRIKKKMWIYSIAWERFKIRAKSDDPNVLVPVILELDDYINDGQDCLEYNEFDEAIKLFQKVVDCDPEYNEGYELLGMTYLKMGQKEEARKYYKLAIDATKNMIKRGDDVDPEILADLKVDLARIKG